MAIKYSVMMIYYKSKTSLIKVPIVLYNTSLKYSKFCQNTNACFRSILVYMENVLCADSILWVLTRLTINLRVIRLCNIGPGIVR